MSEPSSGPIHIKVTRIAPEQVSTIATDEKNVLDHFQNVGTPLSFPREPKLFNEIEARQRSVKNLLDLSKVNEENQAKSKKVNSSFLGLFSFARRHPFLTAGMAVALVLLVLSFQTLSTLLAQHTSMNILHAHMLIGGGVVFMFLYYAVMLNNMRKKAQVEDDSKARIRASHEFTKALMSQKEVSQEELLKNMNQEIQELWIAQVQEIKQLTTQRKELKSQYDKIETSRQRLHKLNKDLYFIFSMAAEKMEAPIKQHTLTQLKRLADAIVMGSEKLECPSISQIPFMPQIEVLSTEITLPSEVSEDMKRNQSIAAKLGKKLNDFTDLIGSTLTKNLGSKVYYSIGMAILALAGVGLYLWLTGYSNVYFFGMLGLPTLVPMAIYGICMIYEGWNNSSINQLNATIEEIEREKNKRILALEDQKHRLEAIVTKSKVVFKEFQHEWLKYREQELDKTISAMQALKPRQEFFAIETTVADTIRLLLGLFPELKEEEITSGVHRNILTITDYVKS